MHALNRREFLITSTMLGASALAAGPAYAQLGIGGVDRYDLVVRGGQIIDPSQKLNGKFDLGIKHGKVAAIAPSIPIEKGAQSIDATGKLVVPGLIDLHAHTYAQGSAIGIPADELAFLTGTTTFVSAGDAGGNNFSAFRRFVAAQAHSRMYAFIHISSIGLAGFPVGEMLNLDYANIDLAAKVLAENADIALGIKVRETLEIVGANGIEPLRRARMAAERSGVKGARVMCHIGNAPGDLSVLLDLLRPGDILTHAFSAAGNNTVQNGKLIGAALEAKKRGVIIDVGHGGASFSYEVAEAAIAQGLTPDTISSDLHAYSGNSAGNPLLPNVMSKFLNMGFSLDQVIAMTTNRPGAIINRLDKLGTLMVGAPADVSVLQLVDGPVEFVDTMKVTRKGDKTLKPVQVVRNGIPLGKPFPSPFA